MTIAAPNITIFDVSNVTDPISAGAYINTITGDLYGILSIFSIWVIIFIVLKKSETKIAFTATSFITTFIAGLVYMTGLIGNATIWVCVMSLLVSLFVDMWTNGDEG